ncbi:MAG: PKD domain-containing protein [Bacteroidota bacterium]|nr:PKD domain-containing protein [Bacteroidota bacterium]
MAILKTIGSILILLLVSANTFSQNNLEFIENKGQWDKQIRFKGEMSTGAFLLQNNGYRVVLYDKEDLTRIGESVHKHGVKPVQGTLGAKNSLEKPLPLPSEQEPVSPPLRGHAYEMRFLHANPAPEIVPDKPLETYANYLIGNDPSKWASDCKTYQALTYKNVYPNIDVRYYTANGVLKYDIIVHPGGNPANIAMYFDGAENLRVKDGALQIKTSVEVVQEMAPYTYQLIDNSRKEIPCSYDVKGNIVQFKLGTGYSRSATMVIDPSVVFSTFTGSSADNWGYTATYDASGNFYAGGIVFGKEGSFPVSNGAFQQTYQGGNNQTGEQGGFDIAIMKFDPTGSRRLYATYIGGTNGNEQPHSLVVDGAGNLVIAGRTTSTDYPVQGALKTYGPLGGGWDIVVTKLNANGTGLIGSVRIGGKGDDGVNIRHKYSTLGAESIDRNYGDDARSEVILDNAGNILFASCTQSSNFPVTAVSVQTGLGGINAKNRAQDAVILKLTPDLGQVLFSVIVGGNDDDAAFVLAIHPFTNNIFVAGATASSNFPGDKTGAKYATYQGGLSDGFVAEYTSNGVPVRTGFFGTSGTDVIYGIQFDRFGFPYIAGTTTGTWPVVNAPFNQANGKQFIVKLKPDLSDYVYSTVFGSGSANPNLSPTAFLVDRCENVYYSGWGGSVNISENYPNAGTNGLPITADAYQKSSDNSDFYFFVLEKDAKSQLYGSYFGQLGGFGEHVDGGTSRFDRNGVIYQAMCANCSSPKPRFPTTPGVWSPYNGSQGCNLAAVKIAFNLAGIGAGIQASINGVPRDTSGCVPMTVVFTDTIAMGKKYIWDFNDGSTPETTTTPTVTHTFNTIGMYQVRLISVDSSSCNISDTAYVTMRVRDDQAALNMTAVKLPPCTLLAYEFTNNSVANKPFTNTSFRWDFGDGTTQLAGLGKVTHTYASAGTYNVRLVLIDTNYCNGPDSITQRIRIATNVKAQFTIPAKGCVPYTAIFDNTSLGGSDFIWDFGDGTTSTQHDPQHEYTRTGVYRVRLIANDPNTCNQTDTSAYFTITVNPNPSASFTYTPNPTEPNTAVSFLNAAMGASSYKWLFGDGDTLFTISTDTTVRHLFNASGTYNTCLVAYNSAGCSDTTCQPISVTINSLLDVPNAFSPNGDGRNDKIYVRGYGIERMTWTIYNRWGTVVYKGIDPYEGWDGTYNGKIQPQDVYHYTLVVEFSSKERTTKKGDITLLR